MKFSRTILILISTLAGIGAAFGADTTNGPTMAQVLADSKPSDWRSLDPENTLYLDLATGRVTR